MICKLLNSTLMCIVIVCAFAIPAFGISISCSSGDGGGAASSSESFNLDASTSLKENLVLGSGSISMDRQAGRHWKEPSEAVAYGNRLHSAERYR